MQESRENDSALEQHPTLRCRKKVDAAKHHQANLSLSVAAPPVDGREDCFYRIRAGTGSQTE
jgi:hypothetical protein